MCIVTGSVGAGRVVTCIGVTPIARRYCSVVERNSFVSIGVATSVLLSCSVPNPSDLCFSSVMVRPSCRGSRIFVRVLGTVVSGVVSLNERRMFVRGVLTSTMASGKLGFYGLFNVRGIGADGRGSSLCRVSLVPPGFEVLSGGYGRLCSCCARGCRRTPCLFTCVGEWGCTER